MKIWVTGSRGFIGRHVSAQASLAGHEVWNVIRPGTASVDENARAQHVELDLSNRDQVAALVTKTAPDAIIHLAWYARPEDYLASAENIASLGSTLSFARGALDGGCRRLVGVGTCLEYAEQPRPRLETDPLDPKSLYARCKHAAQLVLTEIFRQNGASLAWARLFHMHGPGEHPARLLPALAASLRAGRAFALSPGEQLRDHLDVRDVAAALLHIAACRELEGPVNVCSGKPVTLRGVLEVVGKELGRAELLEFGKRPYLSGEVMNLTGDPQRLSESGWRPKHADLAQSIRESTGTPSPALSRDADPEPNSSAIP